ncbi:hypothetical protein PINS_up011144 [Pythium insidiosum]|nr:hypothetical protein PINS_up011144 [Pythium insidiosum]
MAQEKEGTGQWTPSEHERFLEALQVYPNGPWRRVAEFVGTRNVRQTMTHAQKYRQKLERHQRGLRSRRQAPRDDASLVKTRKRRRIESLESPCDPSMQDATVVPRVSFMDLIKADYTASSHSSSSNSVEILVDLEPLSILPPSLELEADVLPTPVVSDCLDFLIQSFA